MTNRTSGPSTWAEQAVNTINAGSRLVGGVLLIALSSMILLQVGLRYAFNAPIAWAEEFSTACFIWMSFVGAIAATCQVRHIAIATFSSRLSVKGRLVLHAVTMLLIAAIAMTLVVLASEIFGVENQSVSPTLPFPLPRGWIFSGSLIFAGTLIAVVALLAFIHALLSGRRIGAAPAADAAHGDPAV